MTFMEAVEHLCGLAGMEVPKRDPQAAERYKKAKEQINWMEEAQAFFSSMLYRDAGESAREYLKERGLSKTAAEYFGIGFAPDSFDKLRDTLIQKGATLDTLVDTGLAVKPDKSDKKPWDRFRDRIMFPIHDPRGRLVAFSGRALSKETKAKYLNSPETDIFHKGRILFNYHRARSHANDPKSNIRGLIVVEGHMDVVAMVRAGFKHTVAPMGTALTEEQIKLMWRCGPEPTLCFDGDKAGTRAAMRTVDRILPMLQPGQTVKFAMMPEGQDPDDLLQDKGPAAMQSILSAAVPFIDMLWKTLIGMEKMDTPEARAGLKHRIFQAVKEIKDRMVAEQYQSALLQRFDRQYGNKKRGKGKYRKTDEVKPSKALVSSVQNNQLYQARERRIVSAIIQWPEMLSAVDEMFYMIRFDDQDCTKAQFAIMDMYRTGNEHSSSDIMKHLNEIGLSDMVKSMRRDRILLFAAFGGREASLQTRETLWREMAYDESCHG